MTMNQGLSSKAATSVIGLPPLLAGTFVIQELLDGGEPFEFATGVVIPITHCSRFRIRAIWALLVLLLRRALVHEGRTLAPADAIDIWARDPPNVTSLTDCGQQISSSLWSFFPGTLSRKYVGKTMKTIQTIDGCHRERAKFE